MIMMFDLFFLHKISFSNHDRRCGQQDFDFLCGTSFGSVVVNGHVLLLLLFRIQSETAAH